MTTETESTTSLVFAGAAREAALVLLATPSLREHPAIGIQDRFGGSLIVLLVDGWRWSSGEHILVEALAQVAAGRAPNVDVRRLDETCEAAVYEAAQVMSPPQPTIAPGMVREWTHDGRPELSCEGRYPIPDGPWADEPDKRHWVDESTDMDCLMVRNGVGAWCGYVAVTEGHPWFSVDYGQCMKGCPEDDYCYTHAPDALVSVHGGLTFAAFCHESEQGEAYGICHAPLPGRPDRVWWFGFDCAHAGDLAPGMQRYGVVGGEVYRDVAYVEAECARLAQQLAAVVS